jgi:hypothetical protein
LIAAERWPVTDLPVAIGGRQLAHGNDDHRGPRAVLRDFGSLDACRNGDKNGNKKAQNRSSALANFVPASAVRPAS